MPVSLSPTGPPTPLKVGGFQSGGRGVVIWADMRWRRTSTHYGSVEKGGEMSRKSEFCAIQKLESNEK